MNISVNGQSRIPPGFRFHPTEEELLQYYLRKKVANEKIDLDVIFEVDLNKLEPWDIRERCRIGTTPQNDWYFFSHKDKKYPTGTRTNRATVAGFWKATGRDKVIYSNCRRIGMRKTLVFYKGRAPHGQKSDWIMHEYRLDDTSNLNNNDTHVTSQITMLNGEFTQEEGWVVCRIFKKKNHIKTLNSPINNNNNNTSNISLMESHSTMLDDSPSDNDHDNNDQGALEQIFQSLGNNTKFPQNNSSSNNNNNNKFMKLPNLESPNNGYYQQQAMNHETDIANNSENGLISDWATLDRLVATHLNGHINTSDDTTIASIFASSSSTTIDNLHHIHLPPLRSSSSSTSLLNKNYYPNNSNNNTLVDDYGSNSNEIIDLWSFTRSTLTVDPLCHVSDSGI